MGILQLTLSKEQSLIGFNGILMLYSLTGFLKNRAVSFEMIFTIFEIGIAR